MVEVIFTAALNPHKLKSMLHYSAMLPYLEYHPILKYGDNSTRQSIFYPVRLILFPYNILLHPRTYQLVSLTNWLMIGPIPDI
jgi:hypothetical protein